MQSNLLEWLNLVMIEHEHEHEHDMMKKYATDTLLDFETAHVIQHIVPCPTRNNNDNNTKRREQFIHLMCLTLHTTCWCSIYFLENEMAKFTEKSLILFCGRSFEYLFLSLTLSVYFVSPNN